MPNRCIVQRSMRHKKVNNYRLPRKEKSHLDPLIVTWSFDTAYQLFLIRSGTVPIGIIALHVIICELLAVDGTVEIYRALLISLPRTLHVSRYLRMCYKASLLHDIDMWIYVKPLRRFYSTVLRWEANAG